MNYSTLEDNLKKYQYCYAKLFVKNPSNTSLKSKFYGEVYEASFYEELIYKIVKKNSNFKILEKGPYIKNKLNIKEGFSTDKTTKSCYFSSFLTRAEFDAIIYNDNELFFYECTTSSISNKNNLKKNIKYKKELLSKIFPKIKNYCILVSNNQELLSQLEKDLNIKEIIYYDLPPFDLLNIAKNANYKKIIEVNSSISSFGELNKIINIDFSFFNEFKKISEDFYLDDDLEKLYNKVKASYQVVQRIYWGKISLEDYIKYIGKKSKIKEENIIVSINFKNIMKPQIRFYYKIGNNYYDAENSKKLNSLKASKKELNAIYSLISIKKFVDIKDLEEKLKILC